MYLSEVFNGIQKLAKVYTTNSLESMRMGSIDQSIGPHERESYRKAYEKAMKATRASGSNPTGTSASAAAPKPTAAPGSTTPPPTPPPRTTPPPTPPPRTAPPPTAGAPPRPTTTGVGNAGFGPTAPTPAASGVNPFSWKQVGSGSWKQIGKVGLKGNLRGAAINIGADYAIPKFKGDGFLAGMGNEFREAAIAAGSGAASAAAVSGGALALPGLVSGLGWHALGKTIDAGVAVHDASKMNQEVNEMRARVQKMTGKTPGQVLEEGKRLRALARSSAPSTPPSIPQESKMPREAIPANAIVPAPVSTPVAQESRPIPLRPAPVSTPVAQESRPIPLRPVKTVEPLTTNGITGALNGPSSEVNNQILESPQWAAAEVATGKLNDINTELTSEIAARKPQSAPSTAPKSIAVSTPPQVTPPTPIVAPPSTPVATPATPVAPKSTNITPPVQIANTQGPDNAFLSKVMGSYNRSSALDKRKADAIRKIYKPGMTANQIYADKGYISASRRK